MTDAVRLFESLETQSSIFDKTTPELRRRVNQAVVDHDPPTYRGVYDKFRLADYGVGFHAFYRYARRLRFNAAALSLAELTGPDDADVVELLPRMIGHRLLDAVADENASPRAIQRLADAWRIVAATRLALGRHAAQLEDLKRKEDAKESDRLLAIVRQYIKAQKEELRADRIEPENAPAAAAD